MTRFRKRGGGRCVETVENIDGWDRIISSPLSRCAEFANWLAEQRDLPLEICDDLREVGFGAWEGLNRDQLRRNRAADYLAFFQDPVNNRPAGAEPLGSLSRPDRGRVRPAARDPIRANTS